MKIFQSNSLSILKNRWQLLLLPMILGISCTSNVEKIDTSAVKAKMGDYKIQKVTEAQIMGALNKAGSKVYQSLTKDCDANALELPNYVNLRRIEQGESSSIEKEEGIFQALDYSLGNGELIDPTPQKLNDTLYAYYFTVNCDSVKAYKVQVSKRELIRSMAD
ncbi:hypothetical protein [Jiulongibacter sp. NS-SX5]|uniref:hypothetical protein n=1 Tax=Jiulongibacter sp. NS-SX5 TaxID=3463854 RepID=UPI004058C303